MIVPKETPIVIYKGNISSYTQSVREDDLYISTTTRDIQVINIDIDKQLHNDLHNQIRTFCNTFGIKMGVDDLLVHGCVDENQDSWYFFTNIQFVKKSL